MWKAVLGGAAVGASTGGVIGAVGGGPIGAGIGGVFGALGGGGVTYKICRWIDRNSQKIRAYATRIQGALLHGNEMEEALKKQTESVNALGKQNKELSSTLKEAEEEVKGLKIGLLKSETTLKELEKDKVRLLKELKEQIEAKTLNDNRNQKLLAERKEALEKALEEVERLKKTSQETKEQLEIDNAQLSIKVQKATTLIQQLTDELKRKEEKIEQSVQHIQDYRSNPIVEKVLSLDILFENWSTEKNIKNLMKILAIDYPDFDAIVTEITTIEQKCYSLNSATEQQFSEIKQFLKNPKEAQSHIQLLVDELESVLSTEEEQMKILTPMYNWKKTQLETEAGLRSVRENMAKLNIN